MQTKTGTMYKAEIKDKLVSTQNQVEKIITQLNSNCDWKDIHNQVIIAIYELRNATKLLVKYHLEVCVGKKLQRLHFPIVYEDFKEIIKTYRYLN